MTGITSAPQGDAAAVGPRDRPQVRVVPLWAVPAVAVALAGLVAAVVSNTLWALGFFHVVSGALWIAINLFVGFIVGPTLARLPEAAGTAFLVRLMPKLVLLVPTLVITTLVAAWQLTRHQGAVLASPSHHGLVVATIVVVGVIAVITIGILEPANLGVIFELRKPAPNGELIGRLMQRCIYAAAITAAMQVASVIMTLLATR